MTDCAQKISHFPKKKPNSPAIDPLPPPQPTEQDESTAQVLTAGLTPPSAPGQDLQSLRPWRRRTKRRQRKEAATQITNVLLQQLGLNGSGRTLSDPQNKRLSSSKPSAADRQWSLKRLHLPLIWLFSPPSLHSSPLASSQQSGSKNARLGDLFPR